MLFDATFWVAISFVIFFGILIYFKIPQKINEVLSKMIIEIRKEIDESEKLRKEAKSLLDNSKIKLESADTESKKIIEIAKKDAEKLIIEINNKFYDSAEIKKNLTKNKINQMKEGAIKDIKNASVKIAVDTVKKVISSSLDKSKLDVLFEKNLKETKEELKNINSH
ncbi:MAG: ATPase [Candidatus Pelagibacter sp.]|nr:ATPase [Candidatus Pelagibacter sp.]|tara:strand:+ start:1643 stop:2143 length:501 start_codon:yes stop_codon:yes gene_type:complete